MLLSPKNGRMVDRPKTTTSDFVPTKRPPKENETFLEIGKRDGGAVLLGVPFIRGYLVIRCFCFFSGISVRVKLDAVLFWPYSAFLRYRCRAQFLLQNRHSHLR